ncbi:MAG: hypothetical protein QOE71_1918 [Pseudonocardiales bacterium]|nr:hypothetical protein [Pseudonocardiales bacterium]
MFAMSKVGYFYLRHIAPRYDKWVIPLTNGRFSSVGFNVVGVVSTIGAKSGRPREQPLLMIADGPDLLVIGSNYGRLPHPSWAHNLKVQPNCTVQFRGPKRSYRAELLSDDERAKAWTTAVDFYNGYETYRQTCSPREIRIFRLRPAG